MDLQPAIRYEEYLLVSLRALNRSEDAGYARGVAVAATALGLAADFMARFGLDERFHRRAREVAAEVESPADAGFAAFGQAYHAYENKGWRTQINADRGRFTQIKRKNQ